MARDRLETFTIAEILTGLRVILQFTTATAREEVIKLHITHRLIGLIGWRLRHTEDNNEPEEDNNEREIPSRRNSCSF